MSIGAVAARAGVGEPTVSLRHSCKADRATAALAAYQQRALPRAAGDTPTDVVALARARRLVLRAQYLGGMPFDRRWPRPVVDVVLDGLRAGS